jgi:DNA-binding IscR family transcriptional regulator
MQINAKTTIGRLIVKYLSTNDNVKSNDLVNYIGCSAPYFEQCVKPLVDAGIVITKRGCKGGYELREGVITFWDLISANNNKGWDFTGDSLDSFIREVVEVAKKHKVVG